MGDRPGPSLRYMYATLDNTLAALSAATGTVLTGSGSTGSSETMTYPALPGHLRSRGHTHRLRYHGRFVGQDYGNTANNDHGWRSQC